MVNRNPYKFSSKTGGILSIVLQKKLAALAPWLLVTMVLGFLVTLAVFNFGVPQFIRWSISQETQLRNGSATWEKWSNLTVPVFYIIHVFNITNPNALQDGEKFKLQELGPYYYEEKRTKNIIRVEEESDTLTYEETITYFFRPDLSQGDDLKDRITTVNFAYLSLATITRQSLEMLSGTVASIMGLVDEDIIKRDVSVRELIFTGYEISSWYNWLSSMGPKGAPREFTDDKFAYLNAINGSIRGRYKISTGIKDASQFGQILEFNEKEELDFWSNVTYPENSKSCNKINGSDGSLYPPFVTKDTTLYLFDSTVCRSLSYVFDKETNYKGVPAYEARLPRDIFSHPDVNPETQCFCKDPGGGLKNDCIPGGFRVNSCKHDSPLIVSKPHFLDGAPELLNAVEGLKPDRDKHDSILEVEPNSGMLLSMNTKVQIVAELQPLPGAESLENLPHLYLPVFWLEEGAYLQEGDVDYIKGLLVRPLQSLKILEWTVYIALGISITFCTYFTAKLRMQKQNVHSSENAASTRGQGIELRSGSA